MYSSYRGILYVIYKRARSFIKEGVLYSKKEYIIKYQYSKSHRTIDFEFQTKKRSKEKRGFEGIYRISRQAQLRDL